MVDDRNARAVCEPKLLASALRDQSAPNVISFVSFGTLLGALKEARVVEAEVPGGFDPSSGKHSARRANKMFRLPDTLNVRAQRTPLCFFHHPTRSPFGSKNA
jgi:hypothetical protein